MITVTQSCTVVMDQVITADKFLTDILGNFCDCNNIIARELTKCAQAFRHHSHAVMWCSKSPCRSYRIFTWQWPMAGEDNGWPCRMPSAGDITSRFRSIRVHVRSATGWGHLVRLDQTVNRITSSLRLRIPCRISLLYIAMRSLPGLF